MSSPIVVQFRFSIGDHVKIVDTGHPGRVSGLLCSDDGKQYRVAWWNNGVRAHDWFLEWELVEIREDGRG